MSEQSYPGPATPDDAVEVAIPVDGELLDPTPPTQAQEAEDVIEEVIEGEAIDLDEADASNDIDDASDSIDDDASDDGEQDGATSTDVLVLESWQIAIPATGDATVDAALARLADVEGLPPAQHADVYEAVHAGLHEALADLDRA